MLSTQKTADGSLTLFSERFQETYHSRHGAKTESLHVFIQHGLQYIASQSDEIRIGEIGLGTGLNAMLSCDAGRAIGKKICYFAIEAFPVSPQIMNEVVAAFPEFSESRFLQLLYSEPGTILKLLPEFEFVWFKSLWPAANPFSDLDVLYYDAFAPGSQPELWTHDAFYQAFQALRPGGILVTYCAKGDVRRNMKSVGFEVEKLPGPPGKREMTRAKRPD